MRREISREISRVKKVKDGREEKRGKKREENSRELENKAVETMN
jgi:hypothetical protein